MRHRWTANNGDTCAHCGLHREGAGAGPYGAMRYYRDDSIAYDYKPGDCPMGFEHDPLAVPAHCASLAACDLCERGFRRLAGIHVGSQSVGMIPNTRCERVFVAHLGNATEDNSKPWVAYVDGKVLSGNRAVRRFKSPRLAYRAACAAAPRLWHD